MLNCRYTISRSCYKPASFVEYKADKFKHYSSSGSFNFPWQRVWPAESTLEVQHSKRLQGEANQGEQFMSSTTAKNWLVVDCIVHLCNLD